MRAGHRTAPGLRPATALRLGAAASLLLLTACGGSETTYVERPADELYGQAEQSFREGDLQEAVSLFGEVGRQHPYSSYAADAELMSAYASYRSGNYDQAIVTLDNFIAVRPGNPNLAYAYYLKALTYYDRIVDVGRDQAMTQQALIALNDVISRFPDSEYAQDARLKRDLTYDQLAGKEMSIGRFYLYRGDLNAAINRFKNVIRTYQTTSHVPEALHRLVEAYTMLGLHEEARHVAAVLGYNYPGSDWYLDTYALLVDEGVRPPDDRSFLDRTLDSIL